MAESQTVDTRPWSAVCGGLRVDRLRLREINAEALHGHGRWRHGGSWDAFALFGAVGGKLDEIQIFIKQPTDATENYHITNGHDIITPLTDWDFTLHCTTVLGTRELPHY